MTRMTPEIVPWCPVFHTTPTGGHVTPYIWLNVQQGTCA
ncbi:hypothetical protein AVEN_274164-1, partial [Araneus ventricosus]